MSRKEVLLFITGVNHHTLSADGREQCSRLFSEPEKFYQEFCDGTGLNEFAVISTCNRFEIVVAIELEQGSNADSILQQAVDSTRNYLTKRLDQRLGEKHFSTHFGENAIRYLFRVTASLESLVIGEAQILGQVKKAYQQSVALGHSRKILHRLFQSAFHLAKKVRSHTKIADRPVSISYVAVKLVQQIFGDVAGCRTLVIGSGHMAELAALHLVNYGCQNLIIANRTLAKAEELAGRMNGTAISLDEIPLVLPKVDVVIGSLAIDRPLIEISRIQSLVRKKPLFFIDLGMPRNFPSKLAELENAYLYNIDDLAAIVDEHRQVREEAAGDAEVLVEFAVHQYLGWLARVSYEPTLLDLRSRIQEVCRQELEDFMSAAPAPAETQALIRKISQKISHDVTCLLKEKVTISHCSRSTSLEEALDFLNVSSIRLR